ncbi:MAG TPA: TIGR01777 family oxidoreductase [Acidimicrobiales bacterium]
MHLLLTGSSGLIGTALVDAALARGDTVTRLVRDSTDGRHPAPTGVSSVAWDPSEGTIDTAALDAAGPFDGAVHLAGAGVGDKRWSPDRKREIIGSRTRSTGLLARTIAALTPAPPVLVSASAVGYYGDRGDEVLTEASPAGSGFLARVCVDWEEAASPAAEADIRTVLLRTGIVLSRSGGALAKQLPLFRLGVGGRIGSGRQFRSWITLDDQVAVILYSLGDATLSGPVNAVAPHPVTDAELATALGRALDRPSFMVVPAPALKLALGSEMATDMVLASQRVRPEQLERSGFGFLHPDLDEALHSVLTGS